MSNLRPWYNNGFSIAFWAILHHNEYTIPSWLALKLEKPLFPWSCSIGWYPYPDCLILAWWTIRSFRGASPALFPYDNFCARSGETSPRSPCNRCHLCGRGYCVKGVVLERRWNDIMDMTGTISQGKLVTVIVLEGLEQAGLSGDYVVHLEVIKQDLYGGSCTWRLGYALRTS